MKDARNEKVDMFSDIAKTLVNLNGQFVGPSHIPLAVSVHEWIEHHKFCVFR